MSYDIPKLAKRLNLHRPDQAEYLGQCLREGKTFFCTRLYQGTKGRAIQSSGNEIEHCIKTFEGWQSLSPKVIEVKPDSTVVVHRGGSK